MVSKLEDILPPKGASEHYGMRDNSIIITIPDQLNSRYLRPIIEFMQMLEKESLVLNVQIKDS